ncbi:hypothetical protein CEXT_88161 [Caerostris extrusa]|uniref:Maturase K n=1 Tax=Caerostris extrusa TaxID=172846 RepID=A0AAV4WEM1_CAEEX|nr:hypothetical protein CEXT_88161 [Caerostris extrusa]
MSCQEAWNRSAHFGSQIEEVHRLFINLKLIGTISPGFIPRAESPLRIHPLYEISEREILLQNASLPRIFFTKNLKLLYQESTQLIDYFIVEIPRWISYGMVNLLRYTSNMEWISSTNILNPKRHFIAHLMIQRNFN